jgi:hypothetical protein
MGTHPVRLSITHKRRGPELCADLDVGQVRKAAPYDDAAWRRIASPREVPASSRKLDEVEAECAGLGSPIAGVADESIKQADFIGRERDPGRRLGFGSRQHGEPENPPTENAKDRHQIREPFRRAQFGRFGPATRL